MSVSFTTTNGSAVAGVNYNYTTNTLVFPLGEAFQTVLVPVMDDHVITSNLTVNLLLSNAGGGAVMGDQATALLTIINDDSSVAFQSAGSTVPKNVLTGFANISIVRVGSTSGSCSVDFATGTNGNAVIGTDYYPTNAVVTFNPGDTSEIVQIPIINNLLAQGNRTVTMSLTNAVNSTLISPSNATLTIIDTVHAPGDLFFAGTNFSAYGSDGVGYLSVARTNGTSGSISVTYYTLPPPTNAPGIAQPYVNYVPITNSVTFNDGDTNKLITVPLVNNPIAQSSVSLTVALINPTGGAGLVAPTNAILTINNTNPVFSFTLATNLVPEDSGHATIVVWRQNNTNLISSINYATVNANVPGLGNAVPGINYSNVSGTLVFNNNETFKSFLIPVMNRTNVSDLAFGVNLFNPVNAQLFQPSNTVVILQASAVGVSFATNSTSVRKDGGSVQLTVTCSNPRVAALLAPTNPVTITVKTVDGTAKAGIDYGAIPVPQTIVFTNGLVSTNVYISIINAGSVSGDLNFSAMLTNASVHCQITPYATETVTMTEVNPGVRFAQSQYSAYKNAGVAPITVYRTGFTDSVATVQYFVTNGTAIAGQNFVATNGTLVFTNGITVQTFNVQLIANSQVQPNLIALMRLAFPTNASIVKPGAATLAILENGGSYVTPAGAMMLTNFTAHRSDGIIGSNDTVRVAFAFRDAAGLSVTNLIAYLLPTNGVTAPNPASQTYGSLAVYGHSVSMPFTFTAHGTNTSSISPTFQLYDNGKIHRTGGV